MRNIMGSAGGDESDAVECPSSLVQHVPNTRRLDLDHVGAKVAEHLPAEPDRRSHGQAQGPGRPLLHHQVGVSHPNVNGSRVAPLNSTHTDLVSVYSRMASMPFSRPMPLAPKPPKGTCGPTTR